MSLYITLKINKFRKGESNVKLSLYWKGVYQNLTACNDNNFR